MSILVYVTSRSWQGNEFLQSFKSSHLQKFMRLDGYLGSIHLATLFEALLIASTCFADKMFIVVSILPQLKMISTVGKFLSNINEGVSSVVIHQWHLAPVYQYSATLSPFSFAYIILDVIHLLYGLNLVFRSQQLNVPFKFCASLKLTLYTVSSSMCPHWNILELL